MSLDEVTLLAYVDGELPAKQSAEVEAALAGDPRLARNAQALRASRLPYAGAYAQQALPPVPDALRVQVDQLVAAPLARPAPDPKLALAGGASAPGGGRFGLPQMAAALAALALAAALGWWAGQRSSGAAGGTEPWVRMVSSYHAMYGRETVLDGGVASAQVAALKTRLKEQQGLQLQIPDLQAQGLQFVRAQQLQLDGQMVLQLVYLPAQGLPVALCLTPAAAQPERSLSLNGQQALTWWQSGWAYVLIGKLPAPELAQLRNAIKAPVV